MKSVFFFVFLFGIATAFSQQDVNDSLRTEFNKYQSQTMQEKLFVHTDKNFYVAGEIMWFKIYDVDAANHRPLDISKVSYVEIVDKENKPVLQAKINMQSGSGNGSFLLPFSISSGNYIVKAYTAWMKNFSSDFFFEKQITIVNTIKKGEWQGNKDTAAYNIQFLPEGGNWVDGLQSVVAFKVTNQYGQSVQCSGLLLNEKNDTLLRFQSFKFGMGKFVFTPSINEKYKAVITINNRFFVKSLPNIYKEGYVMKLTSLPNNQLSVSVQTNTILSNPVIYLFVHSQQSVQSVQMKVITNGTADFLLNKNDLDEGISHLTLFNNARKPLCERLYCKQPKQQLIIDVKSDQSLYGTRKKIQLQISAQNQLVHPLATDLSLSIFRLDSLQQLEPADIFNYVWLQSEIKGNIESPDYYLKDTSAEAQEALDNLMLTQGWRRFQWDDVLQNKTPSFHFLPEYEGQIIIGAITHSSSGSPANNINAYLSFPGEKFRLSSAASNDSGIIKWTANRMYGAGEAVVQINDSVKNNYHISIASPFSKTSFYTSVFPFHIQEKWQSELLEKSIAVQTQNAYLFDERQNFILSDKEDTTVFYGKPDRRYLLDDYTRFPTMEEVMREYVTEVRVSKQEQNYHYEVDNSLYKSFFKNNPLVLLDGVPVWDINKIVAYNPLQVRQLDVVTHKYFLGNQTYDGIVSYLTYKGIADGLELNPNSIEIEYEGLQLQRQFYSPVYESEQQKESRLPDFRNLLYWLPNAGTNNTGKRTIDFYTSDLEGNYAIVVQGNAANGLVGSKVVTISVKK